MYCRCADDRHVCRAGIPRLKIVRDFDDVRDVRRALHLRAGGRQRAAGLDARGGQSAHARNFRRRAECVSEQVHDAVAVAVREVAGERRFAKRHALKGVSRILTVSQASAPIVWENCDPRVSTAAVAPTGMSGLARCRRTRLTCAPCTPHSSRLRHSSSPHFQPHPPSLRTSRPSTLAACARSTS
jgi:hypothetical protein